MLRSLQVYCFFVSLFNWKGAKNRLAEKGGRTAGVARRAFEAEHGRQVISDQSYLEQRKRLQTGEDDADKE